MPGRLRNSLLVCASALALAGCGGGDDGTIPPDDANNLLNQVEAVQNDVAKGHCETAAEHTQEFIDGVNALPNDVDPKVESELTKAADNLRALVSDPTECASGASGETGVQPTDTTEADTTETDTTPEETTTTTTTEEETSTTDEAPPEENQQEPTGPAGDNQAGAPPGGGNTIKPPTGGEPPSGGLTPPTGGGNG